VNSKTYFISFLSNRYNTSGTGKISLAELTIMMEKLGVPQTHYALKGMIKVTCELYLSEGRKTSNVIFP